MERTLVLVKPDGVEKKLIGEVISRIERVGLKIAGLKMMRMSKELVKAHYPEDDEWFRNVGNKTLSNYRELGLDPIEELGTDDAVRIGKMVKEWLVNYMTSGPVVAIAVEGENAVSIVRKLAGHTLPSKAAPGTIRGDFGTDSAGNANRERRAIMNIVHASDSPEAGEEEISRFFSDDELCR